MLDFLVVGQGVAGTMLTESLLALSQSVKVIDNNPEQSSSRIAAGIINPVTGRRYVKSWMVDQLIPKAVQRYSSLEELLAVELIDSRDILRVLHTIEQQNDWMARCTDQAYAQYIDQVEKFPPSGFFDIDPQIRMGRIRKSYQINLPKLVKAFRAYLIKHSLLETAAFDHDALIPKDDHFEYKGSLYKKVIFAEGYGIRNNKFFSYLPREANKGEALYLDVPGLKLDELIRDRIFMVPQENVFWSGGGYNRAFENVEPTSDFKESYIQLLSEMLKVKFSVVDHKAAIRLASKDRKPLIGRHPSFKNMYLFNGFGTKGASLTPYFSEVLCQHILSEIPLPIEVDITRYEKHFEC